MLQQAKVVALSLGLAVAGLGFAACNDDDGGVDVGTPGVGLETPESTSPADDGAGGPSPDDGSGSDDSDTQGSDNPGDWTVEIGGGSGDTSLEIDAGTTVTFVNEGDQTETVTINGNNESGDLEPGESFDFTFDSPGDFLVTSDYNIDFLATISVA
jgi:hypothetical protein